MKPLLPTQERVVAKANGITVAELRRRIAAVEGGEAVGVWMSVSEAADACGCSQSFVRETLIAEGFVNAKRNGRRWVVRRDSLNKYIESGQTLPERAMAAA